jgi:HAD superfamily hydrolase (TIGR01509 family)
MVRQRLDNHRSRVHPVTGPTQLQRLLAGVRLIMLDFDGPICRIFAHYAAPDIAEELRRLVATRGLPLTHDLLSTDDPLQVLRLVGSAGSLALTREVATALRDAEVIATETAEPTPGVADVLDAAEATGRALAVVSNNSREAITAYLDRYGISSRFAALVARQLDESPALMKPDPHLLRRALAEAQVGPRQAVIVGDSVTDVLAAKAASVPSIGFRPDEADLADLVQAGADATVDSLHDLAGVLARSELAGPPAPADRQGG